MQPTKKLIHPIKRCTFSDLIAGYVKEFDKNQGIYTVYTRLGEDIRIHLKAATYAQLLRNLNAPYADCTNKISNFLAVGSYIFTYATFYPEKRGYYIEAQSIIVLNDEAGEFFFEQPDWWLKQIDAVAEFYLKSEFDNESINYKNYRTKLKLSGEKFNNDYWQESAVLSRLIYGFSTAYLTTGKAIYLEAAQKGCQYLQEKMRCYDDARDLVYWFHGLDIQNDKEKTLLSSQFGDDYGAIPAYEQIYVLSGMVQTYRITGDSALLADIQKTIKLFDDCFFDSKYGGYFSHIDPMSLDPHTESLGENRAKKNWNSIGDHAPAYLINLWLATQDPKYKAKLEYNTDLLVKYFPDYPHSELMQERFYQDWSADKTYKWQQDRGIIGHNLKLLWNMQRVCNLVPKKDYVALIHKIARRIPNIGFDKRRSGWYDAIERLPPYRFSFHDRKTWWQQEQGILAYLILAETTSRNRIYKALARESAAFYNAFLLDHEDGAVYFGALANGIPYLKDIERLKGSHSMGAYHTIELAYLAQVYSNLFITKTPITLYFAPQINNAFDSKLYVAPDIFPNNRVYLTRVWLNEKPYTDFEAEKMLVYLPPHKNTLQVKVEMRPK